MTFSASLGALGWAWLFVVGVMLGVWLVELRTRNAGWVDAAWAGSLGSIGIGYGLLLDATPYRRLLVAALIACWSLRLTWVIVRRVRKHREEDPRYQRLRARAGARAHAWFFGFFQIQALAGAVLSLCLLTAMFNPAPLATPWTWMAVICFAIALAGESLADAQLARFRANPAHRGATCRIGLWRYSRHPNYFFEWMHWWTYALLSIGYSAGWWSLLTPLLMLYFLVKVTGLPETERHAASSRSDYADYQKTVSPFIPWFPKETNHEPD